ncbi:MAG: molybdenum cofactor guanylyltransferase [Blastocatellia bacterium]
MNAPDSNTQLSDCRTSASNPARRCFIQAGGRSARMGEDKSWLMLNGRSLIEHALATASQVAGQLAIIINSASPHRARYQALAQQWQAEIIDDIYDYSGPLGGFYTALTRCAPPESALMLACDLPFVTPELLQLLWQIHQAEQAELTIPLDRRHHAQMLVGVYAAACRERIARMLAWKELMTDRLCLRVRTRLVTYREYAHLPGAEQLSVNINTPADYQALASSQPE